MKTKRSLLIRALQERFVPILLKNGFTQSKLTGADAASGTIRRAFPFGCMKRPKGVDIELVDIQMDKRGKLRFVVYLSLKRLMALSPFVLNRAITL